MAKSTKRTRTFTLPCGCKIRVRQTRTDIGVGESFTEDYDWIENPACDFIHPYRVTEGFRLLAGN